MDRDQALSPRPILTPPTAQVPSFPSQALSRWSATSKAFAKTAFYDVLWLLRVTLVLALSCNTLFVGTGIVVLPFVFLEASVAIALLAVVIVLYSPTYLGSPAESGRRRWRAFQKGFIIKDIIRWFSGDVVKTADLDPNQQYVFGFAPHGIMPLSASWMSLHEKWERFFPKVTPITLGSSVFHYAPLIRDLAMWSGTRTVARHTFEQTLKEGHSAVLIPGGIAELRLSKSGSNVIELYGKHRGFVRMAIRHGTPIVPVYSFGETEVFDLMNVPFLSWFTFRFLKMPFPYFTGVGGFLQIPRRRPITVVVGAPIHLEKDENPSEEKVREIHLRYYEELQKLFEEHKHKYGHADKTLKVTGL